ncbi:MAG: hypothetical protein WBD10_03250, partial [Acidobacteriaceae bacterium]
MKLSTASLCLLSVSALALVFPIGLRAQAGQDAAKSLSPAGQQVIQRLGALNTLPPGEWRMHTGNVPHG